MLHTQPTSNDGIQFGRVSSPSIVKTISLKSDLRKLFAAQAKLQSCIASNRTMLEGNFTQENNTRVDASRWLELQQELLTIEKDLVAALKQAKHLIADNTITKLDPSLVNSWSTHQKRTILLDLLTDANTNTEIVESIDEAFVEEPKAMLAFTAPTTCNDLLALLEEQIKDFSKITKDVELAVTPEQQEDILIKLLGNPNQEEIMFDVFASGLTSIEDFEVSFTTIATYMVLCS